MRSNAILVGLFVTAAAIGRPAAVIEIQPAQAAGNVTATIASVSWLSGTWEGQRGTTTFEERWTPPAGGAILAVSRTISNGRLVAFEFLRIVERNGTLVYIAQPNGRPPTEFTLTKLQAPSPKSQAAEVVFENPAHDYPTTISYVLAADGTLTATTTGGGGSKPQRFVFSRR